MGDISVTKDDSRKDRKRLKKSERRRQILLELKLYPHLRTSDLADQFGVSTETLRRDVDALSREGLISRAHGGASAPTPGQYPGLDERSGDSVEQRERIGKKAASLVQDGETLMIDSGSTTIQLARSLAYFGTKCTVITNSIPVAMALAQGEAETILCPGNYLAAESAVVGPETIEFLGSFHVDRAMIGASALSPEGPSETVQGFAAIKRTMLQRSQKSHLLIDSLKFDRKGLVQVGEIDRLSSIVVNAKPKGDLLAALDGASVGILIAN